MAGEREKGEVKMNDFNTLQVVVDREEDAQKEVHALIAISADLHP